MTSQISSKIVANKDPKKRKTNMTFVKQLKSVIVPKEKTGRKT